METSLGLYRLSANFLKNRRFYPPHGLGWVLLDRQLDLCSPIRAQETGKSDTVFRVARTEVDSSLNRLWSVDLEIPLPTEEAVGMDGGYYCYAKNGKGGNGFAKERIPLKLV